MTEAAPGVGRDFVNKLLEDIRILESKAPLGVDHLTEEELISTANRVIAEAEDLLQILKPKVEEPKVEAPKASAGGHASGKK